MSLAELVRLLPWGLLGFGGLLLLVLGMWPRPMPNRVLLGATLGTLLLSVLTALIMWRAPATIAGLVVIDGFSRLFLIVAAAGAAAIALLTHQYAPTAGEIREEYWSLLLFATLGMALLAAANHLLLAFVALELLSVSLYALIAWQPARPGAIEGGVKYALLAGLAAAFFFYGVALAYAATGHLEPARFISGAAGQLDSLLLTALTLLLVGVGFKLAWVPFHMWAPDVYQAAPAPVTALFATIAKAAVLAFVIRLLSEQLPIFWHALAPLLWVLAVITMTAGNLLALWQQNLKRLLAYSSIAHLGYVLVALAAGNTLGRDAALYYAVVYVVMNLAVFGVVSALAFDDRDRERLEDYRGLGYRHPWFGGAMVLGLLALAGVPPSGGFMAKFLAFTAAFDAGLTALVVIAVLNTALSFFYYLRVIMVFYSRDGVMAGPLSAPVRLAGAVVATACIAILMFGILPGLVLDSL